MFARLFIYYSRHVLYITVFNERRRDGRQNNVRIMSHIIHKYLTNLVTSLLCHQKFGMSRKYRYKYLVKMCIRDRAKTHQGCRATADDYELAIFLRDYSLLVQSSEVTLKEAGNLLSILILSTHKRVKSVYDVVDKTYSYTLRQA